MFDIHDADIELTGEFDEAEATDPWADTRVVADVLPHDLESIPPGPFLFAIVGHADRTKLSGHDLIRLL